MSSPGARPGLSISTSQKSSQPMAADNGSRSSSMTKHCCISHDFLRVASENPNKLAVIHASGGAKLFREFNARKSTIPGHDDRFGDGSDDFFRERATCVSPPIYEGDKCFIYSQLLASVDSLSSRLFSVLRGAEDPHLIRPTPRQRQGEIDEDVADDHACAGPVKAAQMPASSAEFTAELEGFYKPKLLGIYMSPSVDYIVAVLSILRCGEAFIPIDPSWPNNRISSVLSSSNIDLIICSSSAFNENGSSRLDRLNWLLSSSYCSALSFSIEEGCTHGLVGSSNLVLSCDKGKERLFCYVMYTSGSTGKPKGVCGTEQGLINRFLWMQEVYPLNGEELILFKTSISFIDHMQEFLSAILTTSVLVIPATKELKDNVFSLVDYIQAYSIHRLTAVPSLMRAILPVLQSRYKRHYLCSLKLLVLSGEVLPFELWDAFFHLLPDTSILNLYGSTEVSGDCTYFDCKRMPMILEKETLTTIPIGVPISNCDVVIVSEDDAENAGEIYVCGPCVSSGYYSGSTFIPTHYVRLPENPVQESFLSSCKSRSYIRTGDFARRMPSGDLVFLGREDRSIKVNGQRIALEEIEETLRAHPDVADVAVIYSQDQGKLSFIKAFVVLKDVKCKEKFGSCIRHWLVDKLPLAMIPNCFFFIDYVPVSASGKTDYELLGCSFSLIEHVEDETCEHEKNDLLQAIKKAFCESLMVVEVSSNDDFFMMGGNSLAAAHAAHNLGIDMRLLYSNSSPSKLLTALLEKEGSSRKDDEECAHQKLVEEEKKSNSDNSETQDHLFVRQEDNSRVRRRSQSEEVLSLSLMRSDDSSVFSKRVKVDSLLRVTSEGFSLTAGDLCNSASKLLSGSFSRSNKVLNGNNYTMNNRWQEILLRVPRGERSSMKEIWKVHMESCVDASPLVVLKYPDIYLFIGSHSHKFVCINANSGSIQWEVKLGGRVECSAAIVGDFSQVVVGCYNGKIYFLEFSTGNICWTFQTSGEVKSQPVVDIQRDLIWCGSHDHNLYALDYIKHCCVYKLPCGGSLFGSPAIDEAQGMLYVASTNGCVNALSIKVSPFKILWQYDLGVPVFGSPVINHLNGNVIFCLVDGHVVALDTNGSLIWQSKTGGPIFAGACISYALPSQALVCSRSGSVYAFELDKGDLLWEYNIGDPITASPYVDEHLRLASDPSSSSDRLICVCSSSGTISLLRVNFVGEEPNPQKDNVQEFSRLDLQGDIFSSPVMLCGQIFVGCRDDYVRCVVIKNLDRYKM